MTGKSSLLYVDQSPICSILQNYFNALGIEVIQQPHLSDIDIQSDFLFAILIDCALIRAEPEKLYQVYNKFQVPLLVVHDKVDEEICISMLENGADAFLIRPLSPHELYARIKVIAKRLVHQPIKQDMAGTVFCFQSWRLNPCSRQVFDAQGIELPLSAGEYDLLYAFVQQPQQILNREFLLQVTKQSKLTPFDRRIDVQISRLRQKLTSPELIKTIRNVGYVFTAEVQLTEPPKETPIKDLLSTV